MKPGFRSSIRALQQFLTEGKFWYKGSKAPVSENVEYWNIYLGCEGPKVILIDRQSSYQWALHLHLGHCGPWMYQTPFELHWPFSWLMRVKDESEKAGLKLNIQKTKTMASSPITSWQIDEGKVGTVADFLFLGFEITEDGKCSHRNKRRLLLGRKVMKKLDSILKSRNITLLTKVHIVKAMVFPVVM